MLVSIGVVHEVGIARNGGGSLSSTGPPRALLWAASPGTPQKTRWKPRKPEIWLMSLEPTSTP